MEITYEDNKNATNIAKHGVSLADAAQIDWDSCFVWMDDRKPMASLANVDWE